MKTKKQSKLSDRIRLFQQLNKVTNTYALSNYGWVIRWNKGLGKWCCRKWGNRRPVFDINGKRVWVYLKESQMKKALLTAGN